MTRGPGVNQVNFELSGRTEVHLCPVYYATYKEDGVGESFMIMDNLKARGYAIPPMVKTGMDFLHCKILLEELARVHGASHAFISSVQDSGDGPLDAVAFLKKDFLHRDADKVRKGLAATGLTFKDSTASDLGRDVVLSRLWARPDFLCSPSTRTPPNRPRPTSCRLRHVTRRKVSTRPRKRGPRSNKEQI